MIRDNKYLENLLYDIWEEYFCDVARLNLVAIKFGKYSRKRLGSIKLIRDNSIFERYLKKYTLDRNIFEEESVSLITLTRYFSLDHVPEFIIKYTIIHELCHYTHGFNSPLEKRFSHPHRGGIIKKEYQYRGLSYLYTDSKKWLSENWVKVVS